MIKCIYCQRELDESCYKEQEHVIPQSFGKFQGEKEQNPTLNQIVCDECNQFFGDGIDLHLARNTIEGVILRPQYGIKSKNPTQKHKNLHSTVEEGEFKGMKIESGYGSDAKSTFPVSQIRIFNKKTKKDEYLSLESLKDASILEQEGYDIEGYRLFCDNDNIKDSTKILEERGFNIKGENEVDIFEFSEEGKTYLFKSKANITRDTCRALAKIAFNYLAYNLGADGANAKYFNEIRKFIYNDEGDEKKFVKIGKIPILYDDKIAEKYGMAKFNGHVLTLEVGRPLVSSNLTLFNFAIYTIIHSKNYFGLLPIKPFGHSFDIKTKQVKSLMILKKNKNYSQGVK